VEVAEIVDTLVFVAQPDAGDLLQSMKAGVLEVPDVFVVNKADLGDSAARAARELESGLALSGPAAGAERPVLVISARDGTGIDALVDAIDAHLAEQRANGNLAQRRARFRDRSVLESLESRYGNFGLDMLGGRKAAAERIRASPNESAARLADDLGREIEAALKSSR
jgi:LAO/AO transport system kinase